MSSAGIPLHIAVYSDDSTVRQSILTAIGNRPSQELPELRLHEFATGPALRHAIDDKKKFDLFILDGEATPEGGMGIARQIKDEIFQAPPVLLIAGRVQDNWLASWSRADDVVIHPIDPFTLSAKVVNLLTTHRVNA